MRLAQVISNGELAKLVSTRTGGYDTAPYVTVIDDIVNKTDDKHPANGIVGGGLVSTLGTNRRSRSAGCRRPPGAAGISCGGTGPRRDTSSSRSRWPRRRTRSPRPTRGTAVATARPSRSRMADGSGEMKRSNVVQCRFCGWSDTYEGWALFFDPKDAELTSFVAHFLCGWGKGNKLARCMWTCDPCLVCGESDAVALPTGSNLCVRCYAQVEYNETPHAACLAAVA